MTRSLEPSAILNELAATATATAGMAPSMLDRRNLKQTLKRRLDATCQTPDRYLHLFRENPEEQALFLEGILNNETCFFRDATVFAELQRWCLAWFTQHTRPLRILSAPCSTGEEPYSIAALLHEAGIPLDRFTIDALDLSASAIAHAEIATYSGFSLRNIPNPAATTFLERSPSGWRIKKPLRETVTFRQANLLTPGALEPQAYDLICSRNLLIYQTPEARLHVASALAAALAPHGRLVLGAADWGRDLDDLFRLETPINSFALTLRRPQSEPPAPETTQTPPTITTRHSRTTISAQLADINGLYHRALEAFLSPNTREAERLCRQTLYLQPDHLPSLELLARIPRKTPRQQQALHARLNRHRLAAQEVTS